MCIRDSKDGIAGEDLGTAVFSAEDGPLGEDRQAAEGGGFGSAHNGVRQNPIVECDVNAVMVAVERYRLCLLYTSRCV